MRLGQAGAGTTTNCANSNDLINLKYTYGAQNANNGNVTAETILPLNVTQKLTYDAYNRISSANEENRVWSQAYKYDLDGNANASCGESLCEANTGSQQLPVVQPTPQSASVFRLLTGLLAMLWACAAGIATTKVSVRQLRFSPDGRYVLAQDPFEITLLKAQPLTVLFRIPAEDAANAHFTPDSRQIVFVTSSARTDPWVSPSAESALRVRSGPRVERWTIADQTHLSSPLIRGLGCSTETLSPDGNTLACDDPSGTLRIVHVSSADPILVKENFVRLIPLYHYNHGMVDLPNGHLLGDLGHANIEFSPDGRLLIARPTGGEGRDLAYELHERNVVGLPFSVKIKDGWFTLLAPHRLVFSSPPYQAKHNLVTATVVELPSGNTILRLKLPPGPLLQAADPGFVLVNQAPNAGRAAAVELSTGQAITSTTPALDVLGRYYVAEPYPGTVGLYERGKGLQATVVLYK